MSLIYCPKCRRITQTRCLGARPTGQKVRRRRDCHECGLRFSTIESLRQRPIRVGRRGGRGRYSAFAPERIIEDVRNACAKLDLPDHEIVATIERIIHRVRTTLNGDVLTEDIKRVIEEELRRLHPIACYRYAIGARHLANAAECRNLLAELTSDLNR